jgi:glycosyltransferase involved in cell wall biosynthesis
VSGVVFLLGNLTDGGSETKTVRLANRLSKSGIDVHIVYLGAPHTLRLAIDENVAVKFLDRRGKYSIRAYRALKSYVNSNDIESVFCINHYPLVYGWPICRLATGKIRCIGAVNTLELTSLRDRFFMLIYAYILRRCDLVIFGSEAQQMLWTDKYRLRDDKSVLIYNGVDAEHFQSTSTSTTELRESLEINRDTTVIGCVAHLRPEKSQRDLLAAMKILTRLSSQNTVLLLIGSGPEEPQLRRYVETHNLSKHVRFCGAVPDVRPYLELMDIFVLPSSSEVFSNAILEAMAARLPVICTAVGGSVEIVINGETGFTYPRHDVNSLVEVLQKLIDDNDKREQFGQKGAIRVRGLFSIKRMDDQYAGIIAGSSSVTDPG